MLSIIFLKSYCRPPLRLRSRGEFLCSFLFFFFSGGWWEVGSGRGVRRMAGSNGWLAEEDWKRREKKRKGRKKERGTQGSSCGFGSWREAYQVRFLDHIPIAAVFLVIVVTVLSIICALFFLWISFKSDPIPFYLSLGCLSHIFGSCFNPVFPPVREPSDFKVRWGSCVWILCFFLCWLFAIDTLFFFLWPHIPIMSNTTHVSHLSFRPLSIPCISYPLIANFPMHMKPHAHMPALLIQIPIKLTVHVLIPP